MKSLIKPAMLVVVSGLLIFFGAQLLFTQERQEIKPSRLPRSQDTTKSPESVQKETYVSQVIISAPWAEKNLVYHGEESPPGEFGVYQYVVPESLKQWVDAGKPEGPTSFTVAPNGDIYITDPLNKRIQRFDENGNFVSVIPIPPLEKSKYLHIQELPELSDSARAEMLRRAGKLPKRDPKKPNDVQVVPKPKTTNWYQYVWSLICADRSNNIYLLWWGDYTKQTLCKYKQEGKFLSSYPLFSEIRIGGCMNKLYCAPSDTIFFEYSRRLTDKIILSLREYDLLKTPEAQFTFQIGTIDRVFTTEEQKSTLRRGSMNIHNYKKGALPSWQTPGEGWAVENMWNTSFVDQKGNLYRYWSTKEGITITKWYKQP